MVWDADSLNGFKYAYLDHTGPYDDAEITERFHEILGPVRKAEMHVGPGAVGVCYNDPGVQHPEEAARHCSEAGVIMSAEEAQQARQAGLKTRSVTRQENGLRTSLPMCNPASVPVGVAKVYLSLQQHCAASGVSRPHKVAEIYDFAAREIVYYAFVAEMGEMRVSWICALPPGPPKLMSALMSPGPPKLAGL